MMSKVISENCLPGEDEYMLSLCYQKNANKISWTQVTVMDQM